MRKARMAKFEDKQLQQRLWEEKTLKINKWQETLRMKIQVENKEKRSKAAADRTLSKINREIHDATRLIDTMLALEKLRLIRRDAAQKRGGSAIGESRQSFEDKIKDMTRLVRAQLESYEEEEAKLKQVLKTEEEEKSKLEWQDREDQARLEQEEEDRKLRLILFGPDEIVCQSDPLFLCNQYYKQASYSLSSLLQIRAKQHQPKCPPPRSRRQLEMDTLCKQKRKLKKQIRAASSEETNGLLVIWRQLKARHSALSKAESARKKRSQKRKNQERFIRDPFQFARQLFQQPKSRTLAVDREELETHLKKTYSDPTREIPLEETTGFVWPAAPGIKLDSKPPSLQEVIAVVNKARAKSVPGPNGVPYLLYKRCPNVLKKLHKILRSAWKNIKISKEWMTAEGMYIPKEQDSKGINQFRPIPLLNVEGKIFFSVMASRLTKYLTENGYINTSVQKGGIPGVSGCLEHATMIWEAIQRAKSKKLNLDVIWLDLANAADQ
ncbi:reverse transcriptase [Plakobranchus ocellatus]|uniref:Reverse transcriptase n=1 Tax=Plakobranchus ocellatus TaxID=259542 RepID=A0AAV4C018_9GAST|nr:reverse transcriptase [Plakobranchus ocellatus]